MTRRNLTALLCLLTLLLCDCARMVRESTLSAVPLETPRKQAITLPSLLGVAGKREGLTVLATVFERARCADQLRQRARGVRHTRVRADGQSLLGEWLVGGAASLLGGAGLAWTATRAADPEDAPGAQQQRYLLTGGILAGGLVFLLGAVYQQSEIGDHDEDLGERELQKVANEHDCGHTPKGSEALRLTLSDGTQLEAVADTQGQAIFTLPPDIDERLEVGEKRAVLEARSDPKAQAVVAL
jgi:hypothetical protein